MIYDPVDLDADGNDELMVRDQSGQFWWVQFRLPTPIRQKIPVPKDFNLYSSLRGQMVVVRHLQTRRTFLITRQGKKWAMKNLGRLYSVEVKDADQDGQVNDVIVWRGQTRRVFSRMKDGTIIERSNLPDFRVDLDGDGKEDAVYVIGQDVRVRFSSGQKASLKPPPNTLTAVADMDGDKIAEIVGDELSSAYRGIYRRFHCWRYENGRWRKSSSPKFDPKFNKVVWLVFGGGASSGFSPKERLFWGERGAYPLVVTMEGRRAKVWEVRWQKGKWTKRLIGEVPEHNASVRYFAPMGQGWVVAGSISPPEWQEWPWFKVRQYLRRFLPFLHEPQSRFFVYVWDGQRRWTLLGRWKERWTSVDRWWGDIQLADMDGDGEQELALAFPKRVLVAKFENGRWRTSWVEVPFVNCEPMWTFYGFRYGGREWALYQEADSNRCFAIALEKQQ